MLGMAWHTETSSPHTPKPILGMAWHTETSSTYTSEPIMANLKQCSQWQSVSKAIHKYTSTSMKTTKSKSLIRHLN